MLPTQAGAVLPSGKDGELGMPWRAALNGIQKCGFRAKNTFLISFVPFVGQYPANKRRKRIV